MLVISSTYPFTEMNTYCSIIWYPLLHIEENEEFPCDLVLIHSSDSKGSCYIHTIDYGEPDAHLYKFEGK